MSRKTFGAWTGEQECHVHIFYIYLYLIQGYFFNATRGQGL